MSLPRIVSQAEWEAARHRLLVKEKAATRARDALAAERRRLPMVRVDASYVFQGADGEASLVDVFDGRRQLIVYQFMDNGPDDYCSGCSAVIDNVGHLAHLHARDTTCVVVSNMPLAQMTAYWQRMGWTVPFYSSRGTTFSADCGAGNGFGLSVFLRDGDTVYRTYFTNGRGVDHLRLDFNLLDLTPLGRQEAWEDSPEGWPQSQPYVWWRLHDEYATWAETWLGSGTGHHLRQRWRALAAAKPNRAEARQAFISQCRVGLGSLKFLSMQLSVAKA